MALPKLQPAILRILLTQEESLILFRGEAMQRALHRRGWNADDDKDWDIYQREELTQDIVEDGRFLDEREGGTFYLSMLTVFFKQRLVIDKSIIKTGGAS